MKKELSKETHTLECLQGAQINGCVVSMGMKLVISFSPFRAAGAVLTN